MESLTEKLTQKLEALQTMVADKEGGKELLEEVLNLKSQADIKPVELEIRESDVIKRYPVTEAMEIVRCKTCIYFHSTGMFLVSKPTLANNMEGGALFEQLTWLCNFLDQRDEMPEGKDKEICDTVHSMIVNVLSMPLDIFTDDTFFLNVSTYILNARNIYYEYLNKVASEVKDETVEDMLQNQLFEQRVMLAEQMRRELSGESNKTVS